MGVPQGSILSVTLFIVKINSITSCIRNGVDKSLFVDDFGVSYRNSPNQRLSVSIFVEGGVFIQIPT